MQTTDDATFSEIKTNCRSTMQERSIVFENEGGRLIQKSLQGKEGGTSRILKILIRGVKTKYITRVSGLCIFLQCRQCLRQSPKIAFLFLR